MSSRDWAKRGMAQFDRLMPTAAGVTVLVYHRVGGGSGSEVDLDVDVFRAQLEHLRTTHDVISLDAAVERLDAPTTPGGPAPAGNAVVITFDDGTADFCDVVVPALVEADVPATLYASTHFIEAGETFPWGAPPASWAGLRDAVSTGLVTIGSHTHRHLLADRVGAEEFVDDLERSIELIGGHVDVAPTHFAYAKALPGSPDADRAVRSRFRTAALAGNRVNRPHATDLHRLSRTPIQRSDEMTFFVLKAAGGLRLEGELRDLAAKVKYRFATT